MDFVKRLVQGVGKEYAIELLQSEIDSLKGEG
jgi:predicted HTH domain antitoxin